MQEYGFISQRAILKFTFLYRNVSLAGTLKRLRYTARRDIVQLYHMRNFKMATHVCNKY